MKTNYFSILAVALSIVGCSEGVSVRDGSTPHAELTGAGASFPQPFYGVAFEKYTSQTENPVSYGAIGSGAGLRNLADKVVDFAGSDAYLSDEEMKKYDEVIHIPTCMGAIVLAYNVPGNPQLSLTGGVVADIFAGKINAWDDERIKKLNPGVDLPSMPIVTVYRSDGSGSTNVFTDYLCKVSEDWRTTIGSGKTVNFPCGLAAKGNAGVAQVVDATVGSMGYVGSEYAFAQSLPCASMINASGRSIKPDMASISAAASSGFPDDGRIMITNSSAENAYPIACLTWILLYKEQHYAGRSLEQARATISLMRYMLSDSIQSIASEVYYAPLPKEAVEKSLKNLQSITYDGATIQ